MQMRHGRVHDEEKERASCLTMDIYISTIWMGSNAFRRELSIDYVCILVTVAVFLANIFCTSSDSSLLTEHYKGNIKEELQWNWTSKGKTIFKPYLQEVFLQIDLTIDLTLLKLSSLILNIINIFHFIFPPSLCSLLSRCFSWHALQVRSIWWTAPRSDRSEIDHCLQ